MFKQRLKDFLKEGENVSIEAIDYQDDNFADKLASAIRYMRTEAYQDKIRKKYDFDYAKKKGEEIVIGELDPLTTLFEKRFNIRILLIIPPYDDAFVYTPALDVNHVLHRTGVNSGVYTDNNYNYDRVKKEINRVMKDSVGYIDLKKAKLGGRFSQTVHVMGIGADWLFGSSESPETIAGVFLHEIGHLFSYYEYLYKTVYSNAVLDSVIEDLTSPNIADDKKIGILVNLETSSAIGKITDKNKLIKLEKDNIVKVISSELLNNIRSETDDTNVSNTSEYTADQFAVRMGADAAMMADFLYSPSFAKWMDDANARFKTSLGIVAVGVASAILGVAIAPVVALMGLLFVRVGIHIGSTAQSDLSYTINNENLYGTDLERFKRLRNDLVGRLKAYPKSKSIMITIKQIDELNKLMSQIKPPKNVWRSVVTFFSSYQRNINNQREKEKILEDLASNDLFVYGYKFANLKKGK